MDWITPAVISTLGLGLLELVRWLLKTRADKRASTGKREETIEDEYRGDLKSRVAKLEIERDECKDTIAEWQQKHFELRVLYKTLEIQNTSEKSMREQLEWRVKDLEARLNLELKDDE